MAYNQKSWGGGRTPKKQKRNKLENLAYNIGRINSAREGSVIADAYNRGAESVGKKRQKKQFI